MEHGLLAKSPRIEVVDALRGFAVMAIMLLHNIEHFNFYDFPTASSAFMEAMDKGIWETTRRRKAKTSACVSCGGFSFCSLSDVSTGRFSQATY